jgi:RND family efflux transporter MFP subunit
MHLSNRNPETRRSRRGWWLVLGLIVLVVAAGLWRRGQTEQSPGATFASRRGPLDITVVEGGSIQAQESQEIKCEARVGYQGIKILKIVEEGYLVTEADVQQGKVLVELDSSDLVKQLTQQDIEFQSTSATYIEAQQAYDIQKNQNLSDVKAAEQKARFARLDLDKFLGSEATQQIIRELGISIEELERADEPLPVLPSGPGQPDAAPLPDALPPSATLLTNTPRNAAPRSPSPPELVASGIAAAESSEAAPARSEGLRPSLSPASSAAAQAETDRKDRLLDLSVDFSKYADETKLGKGEAKQKFRKFKDDLLMAEKELRQAQTTLDGTKRLHSRDFVSKADLERDEMAYENSRLKVQTAETALELYMRYDFPKSGEETLSKYLEAARELDRARKAAVSKLAQAEARLKSGQARYNLQAKQRTELQEQLEKCTIKAQKQGLVVYGGGEEVYWRGEEQIREGATVRERQAIITIPDMTRMSLRVKIHETYIKKIKKGQTAKITVDAFPDKVLTGEVTKVGVLPDSQNRWMNPDLKVYLTTLSIEGVHDWLKPGMTAKAEIMVTRLPEVVYIPLQAITPIEGKQFCFVVKGGVREQREVKVGEFNDEFIEVRQGLQPGDVVALRGPQRRESESGGQPRPTPQTEEGKSKPAGSSAPQPAAQSRTGEP